MHRFNDNLDADEEKWRSTQKDIINYKDYLQYLPHRTAKLMQNKVPSAIHSFLPPEIVASGIEHSLKKSEWNEAEYSVKWYDQSQLLLVVKLFTVSGSDLISVLRYAKDKRETVILVLSDDTADMLANIEEVLDGLKENLKTQLRKNEASKLPNSTVIDVNWDER